MAVVLIPSVVFSAASASSASGSAKAATGFVFSSFDFHLLMLLFGLVFLAVAVLAGFMLYKPRDYFTWFLLHFGVGSLAFLTVAALALAKIINGQATMTLLTSIAAYIIGTSAAKKTGQTGGSPKPQRSVTVHAPQKGGTGRDGVAIMAIVSDAAGNPVVGAKVVFTSTLGTLTPTSALTDAKGQASVKLTSEKAGDAVVLVVADGASGADTVEFQS
ncbi:MAG: Ig-like domain-containing protein [Thermaerobacter sp.]|nr:Ig-like domain-containing protein [Thermaerobacter sp.]